MLDSLYEIHKNSTQNAPLSFKRYLFPHIDWKSRALCVLGARGVGKTTLLLQYYQEHYADVQKCLYLSCDNIQVVSTGLFNIAQKYFKYGGQALILDEVHTYPSWSREIKNIIDTYKDKQILMSGNSSIALEKGTADLSRRVATYSLKGLSFREYLTLVLKKDFKPYQLKEIIASHTRYASEITRGIPILKYFKDYLKKGYYPYFLEGEKTYTSKLLSSLEKVIAEDIPALFQVTPVKVNVLKKMLWLVAASQPFTPNIDGMSRDLHLSKEYVYHFLDYLEKGGLIRSVREKGKVAKMVRKPGKVYLENTNLIDVITGSLKLAGEVGSIRETFFANQLQDYPLFLHPRADFCIQSHLFEVGGKNKKDSSYDSHTLFAIDGQEIGAGRRIPLYLFGFLY